MRFKFTLGLALAAILAAAPAGAQMIPGEFATPLGFCQLSPVSATALASCNSGAGIPSGANAISMQAATAAASYRDDGTAPTSSVGMQLPAGQLPIWYSGTLSKLQFISATGTVNVLFYRAN